MNRPPIRPLDTSPRHTGYEIGQAIIIGVAIAAFIFVCWWAGLR